MADETTFEELMRRVRAGDPQAAEELVRRYEPTIRMRSASVWTRAICVGCLIRWISANR